MLYVGMQTLRPEDFYKPEVAPRLYKDPLELVLMSDLLQYGADAKHADQLVSFSH